MAANGLNINHTNFSCSICLDLMKDPVSIPCGHSYCMSCINTHWDGEVGKQSYSCPQCRHSFTPRPGLVKNTMLAALMEELKKSGKKRGVPAAHLSPSAAHGHVFCDLCSGTKVKAEKSCLQCLVSYCKEHLQPHFDVPALKKHKLVEPTGNLHENMCSVHNELMKMFCRTDQQCICYLCSVDQHKGHHTVTAAAERTVKERELQTFHQNILQRIEHKEKDLDGLQHHLKNSSRSADAAVENSERSLKELCHLLETKMTFVKQQIRSKQSLKALLQLLDERMSFVKQQVRSLQETEEHRVKELQDKVQQEISELKRKLSELDTLSHTEDHVHFLHKFASLSKVSETSESVNSSQSPPHFQDMVTAAVAKLRRTLQDTSLLDPPAVSNKPQVNTAKTDALPAGAQGIAASQQRQKQPESLQKNVEPPQSPQRDRCTVTLPSQPLQPQVDDPPAPLDSKNWPALTRTSVKQRIFTLKAKHPFHAGAQGTAKSQQRDLQPQRLQKDVPPPQDSSQNGSFNQPRTSSNQQVLQRAENIPQQPCHFTISCPSDLENLELTDLQQYSRRLTFDPKSMNYNLGLDDHDDTSVSHRPSKRKYPPHPARFTENSQVVTKERLTGRCFFQVHAYSENGFGVAVSYPSIQRQGSYYECAFGHNKVSWCLEGYTDHFDFCSEGGNWWREAFSSYITFEGSERFPPLTRIGIFLDHDAGLLAFYKICNKKNEIVLLYAVYTSFTEPLVAGVILEDDQSAAKLL